MDGRPELLRGRRLRVVAPEVRIVGLVPVRAPEALELSAVRVDDDDAFVLVAVGDVGLVGLRVDEHLRHAAEALEVVAADALPLPPDLHEELAVARELQEVRILVAVAANPHVVLVVDEDAVVRGRPLVAGGGTAPVPDEVACGVELEDRRCLGTARPGRRILVGGGFGGRERVVAVHDPDMILGVDAEPDHLAEHPVVRQGFGPERIDLELRRLDGGPVLRRHVLEQLRGETERQRRRDESRPDEHVPFPDHRLTNFCRRLPSKFSPV